MPDLLRTMEGQIQCKRKVLGMVTCTYTFTQLGLRDIVRQCSSASDSDARCPGRSILVLNTNSVQKEGIGNGDMPVPIYVYVVEFERHCQAAFECQ